MRTIYALQPKKKIFDKLFLDRFLRLIIRLKNIDLLRKIDPL